MLKLEEEERLNVESNVKVVLHCLHKFNIMALAHDFALALSLQALFADASAFIIKQTVGVPVPGNSSQENTKKKLQQEKKEYVRPSREFVFCY